VTLLGPGRRQRRVFNGDWARGENTVSGGGQIASAMGRELNSAQKNKRPVDWINRPL